MNRRSILRLLGLVPIAAPAALAAASKPPVALSAIDYTALASDVRGRIDSAFSFDGSTLRVPSLRCGSHLEPQADGSSRFVIVANAFHVTGASLPA
jgi:hypothetical protein